LNVLPDSVTGVGRLKRICCHHAVGDCFLELDHDDLLTPDCIETVVLALENAPAKTFLYSDCLTRYPDMTPCRFHPDFGWRSYAATIDDQTVAVNATFPATARALCDINFTPDHVRVWTRAAYDSAGGHDTTLAVCDDMELIARTYLAGVHFEHIQRPLYIRQLHENNTSNVQAKAIETASASIRDKYLHQLVLEWDRRTNLPHKVLKTAKVADLFGCDANSVGSFDLTDVLHTVPTTQIVSIMNLLYRALVPGGFLLTNTPSICDSEGKVGRAAFMSPDTASYWSENNFSYYTDAAYAKTLMSPPKCRFQTVRSGYRYFSSTDIEQGKPYVVWDAIALKDDVYNYTPGVRKI
jgi:hypothetical protein